MEIKGKVHCFFEQSGTFKNEFKKLGYEAFDYDIQNNFGETDYKIDLFAEIEKGYSGGWGNLQTSILQQRANAGYIAHPNPNHWLGRTEGYGRVFFLLIL